MENPLLEMMVLGMAIGLYWTRSADAEYEARITVPGYKGAVIEEFASIQDAFERLEALYEVDVQVDLYEDEV